MMPIGCARESKGYGRARSDAPFAERMVSAIRHLLGAGWYRWGAGNPFAEMGPTAPTDASAVLSREEIQFIFDELRRADV